VTEAGFPGVERKPPLAIDFVLNEIGKRGMDGSEELGRVCAMPPEFRRHKAAQHVLKFGRRERRAELVWHSGHRQFPQSLCI
jgi:hypothetical protein